MAFDTSVKYFHSAMAGAPVLSGTAGALIAVLDACLKDGFGTQTATSVVVAGGIATVTLPGSNPFDVYSVALLSGATPSGLNGEKRVLSTTSNTFTFDATGISDQTATGTISVKLSPAGWTKAFTGTNLAAYKPSDVTATGCLLRVDDTGTFNARVVGYESMTDVNTGTGPFPTTAQQSGGLYWAKSSAASTAARPWVVFADSKMLYFCVSQAVSSVQFSIYGYGDGTPTKTADAYHTFINGDIGDQSSATPGSSSNQLGAQASASGTYMPRSYTQLASSIIAKTSFPQFVGATSAATGSSSYALPYPNPADGGLYISPYYLSENANGVLRSVCPGFYCAPQNIGTTAFVTKDSVAGVTGLSGKVLKAVVSGAGPAFIDVTGPWR